jgi:hypothetical protein
MAIYGAVSMYESGASFGQIVAVTALNIGISSMTGDPTGASGAWQIVGGSFAAGVSSAMTTAMMGGSGLGGSFLNGMAWSAASAAASMAVAGLVALSQKTAAEQQGDLAGYGRDDFDGTMLAKSRSSGSDTPTDPLDGNVRIKAAGSDRQAVRSALKDILNSTDDGAKTRASFVLRKLEAADIPTNVSLDPTKLYSSVVPHVNAEGSITSVDLTVGTMGLAKGPNVFPDGSIARLDTVLAHELPHAYGYIYEGGVSMSEVRAMMIENQYRASRGYEFSNPCTGRGYCN